MSSTEPLPHTGLTPRNAAERILFHLKMHGDRTAASLGAAFGTSGEAVRQQLVRLAEEGMVESWVQPKGVGRPAQFWRLTEAGQHLFPDTHAALAVDLLAAIRSEFGPQTLSKLIDAREAKTRADYKARLADAATLGERVERLAAIRSQEGYMADWSDDGAGGYWLYENHCPICAAAAACQNFCRSELAVFRDVLGDGVHIERVEHIIAGARRCAYRVTPAP